MSRGDYKKGNLVNVSNLLINGPLSAPLALPHLAYCYTIVVGPILYAKLLVPALSLTVSDRTIVEEGAILRLSFFNSEYAFSVSLTLRVDLTDVAARLVVDRNYFCAYR